MVNQVRLQEGTPERLRKTSLYSVVSPSDRRATHGNLRVVRGRKREPGKLVQDWPVGITSAGSWP